MLSTNDRKWKEFKIEEVFVTEGTMPRQVPTGSYVPKMYLDAGTTPRITATSRNNGVDGYCFSTHKNYRVFSNFISVSFLGSVFYHPYKASLDMKVHSLQLKNVVLNDAISTFLIAVIKKSIESASYGNQLSSTDLPHKRIMLPVDNDQNPDYVFMERFVQERVVHQKADYAKYALKCRELLGEVVTIPSLEEKEWCEFPVNQIFTISSGKRLESYNMTPGSRPFIGAVDSGNGITNYVSNKNSSIDCNVLGVNYNGNGMVISFYHPYECIFSDDVKRFHLKQVPDNKYILLFMKTVILQQKSKYNYGYKFNGARMERQKIMLPVNSSRQPDYNYMEQYIKNKMSSMYDTYLNYENISYR